MNDDRVGAGGVLTIPRLHLNEFFEKLQPKLFGLFQRRALRPLVPGECRDYTVSVHRVKVRFDLPQQRPESFG